MSSSVSRTPSNRGSVLRPELQSGESRNSELGVMRLGNAVDGGFDMIASSFHSSVGETVAGWAVCGDSKFEVSMKSREASPKEPPWKSRLSNMFIVNASGRVSERCMETTFGIVP